MKRAFMSELAIARTLIPSIAGVGLFIFVVLTLAVDFRSQPNTLSN